MFVCCMMLAPWSPCMCVCVAGRFVVFVPSVLAAGAVAAVLPVVVVVVVVVVGFRGCLCSGCCRWGFAWGFGGSVGGFG